MKSAAEVIDRLASLNASDRGWILASLSPTAQARLAKHLDLADPVIEKSEVQPEAPPHVDADHDARHIARIAAADAPRILELLRSEPAWLIHAVLQSHHWPWQLQLLQGLPAPVRAEIARLQRSEVKAGGMAMQYLLSALAEKIVAGQPAHAPKSRFESLLSEMTRKVRRA